MSEHVYKIIDDKVFFSKEPAEMTKEELDIASEHSLKGDDLRVRIAMSKDSRGYIGEGLTEKEIQKHVDYIHMVCLLETLRREGEIEVQGILSFDITKDFSVRKARKKLTQN